MTEVVIYSTTVGGYEKRKDTVAMTQLLSSLLKLVVSQRLLKSANFLKLKVM